MPTSGLCRPGMRNRWPERGRTPIKWRPQSSIMPTCGRRRWVKGWEMCRLYKNCASRRDWHGHGSQAAQPAAAQLILVLPSAVRSSTGRCVAVWPGPVTVVACISRLLPSGSRRACWSFFPADRLQTRPCGRASGNRHLIPRRAPETSPRSGRGRSGKAGLAECRHGHRWPWRLGIPGVACWAVAGRRGRRSRCG